MDELDIDFLPAGVAEDAGVVAELTAMINDVYRVAEDGLWLAGSQRCTEAEVATMIAAGEIVAAVSGGRTVGSIRLRRLDETRAEFGMLVADPNHRRAGIGRALIRFAEERAATDGASWMELEVLVPREWSHPEKVFLTTWYTRIGYGKVRLGEVEESYPALAPLLATPCDFVTYRKGLDKAGRRPAGSPAGGGTQALDAG